MQQKQANRSAPRILRSAALVLVTIVAASACESAVSSVVGVAGRYNLTQINGTAIGSGYTIAGSDPLIVVQSGQIDLGGTSSGPYGVTVNGTRGGAAQTVLADAGTFVEGAGTITFTSSVIPAPNNTYTGTIVGSTLTLPLSGAAFGVAQSITVTLVRGS